MTTNLVGSVVEGTYKRAGRPSSEIALEVSAHVALEDRRGNKVAYLFGTRLDAGSAGSVVLIRANCFKPGYKTYAAKNFKAIDLAGWMVTPFSRENASFAFVEKVDVKDAEWAGVLGGQPLADYVVTA